jgi:hypothetical protein
MRAVDAHGVHAILHKLLDEGRVRGGFGWHGDHDAGLASRRPGTEQPLGLVVQSLLAGLEVRRQFRRRLPRPAGELVDRRQDGVNRREDRRFGAPERRQPQAGKAKLQLADVVPAQRQVVNEIARADLPVGMNPGEDRRGVGCRLHHLGPDRQKLRDERLELGPVPCRLTTGRGSRKRRRHTTSCRWRCHPASV